MKRDEKHPKKNEHEQKEIFKPGPERVHPKLHPKKHYNHKKLLHIIPLILMGIISAHMWFLHKLARVHNQEEELGIAKEKKVEWISKRYKRVLQEAAPKTLYTKASNVFNYSFSEPQVQQVPVVIAPGLVQQNRSQMI